MDLINPARGNSLEIEPQTNRFKADTKTLGIVIYGEPCEYEKTEEFHIPVTKEKICYILTDKIKKEFLNEVESIIVAHEHGEDKKKCHYQCCIRLAKRLNRNLTPFKFDFEEKTYLGMYQKARNPDALWNYCKKEGDFFIEEPLEQKGNVWEQLVGKRTFEKKEIINLLAKEDPKTLLMWGDKINNNYEALVKEEELPPFSWCFPEHLLNMINEEVEIGSDAMYDQDKIKAMYCWFNNFCLPENLLRRQALFLVSLTRGVGKSEFAKRLVPHPSYYIYCRGSLDAAEFKLKESTAKLIILDDISYIGNEREMWKALIAGETVNINTKYHNFKWKGGLPCIVLTNEMSTVEFWSGSDHFKTQCCFINLNSYIGPPGTRPLFLNRVETHFDPLFEEMIEDYRKKKSKLPK